MSKGIGWDIGIKNLAYCSLESNVSINSNNINSFVFNNKHYDIISWADISLVSQIETNMEDSGEVSHINTTLKCSALQETKAKSKSKKENKIDIEIQPQPKVCGKSAFYCKEELQSDSSGNTIYSGLCKTHFKKSGEERLPELTVKQCWDKECKTKPLQVLKSHIYKGYCKKHINEMIKTKTHTSNDFLKINRAKTTSKFDINQLGIALFQELDKIETTILDPSIILLENQPVLKNPTMKSMQMFLYSYYLIRLLDKNKNSVRAQNVNSTSILNDKKIQCYCASKKLDLIKFLPENDQKRIIEYIDTVNSGYQKNKKMAIMMVETLLKENTKWLDFFKGHPKKDDLADSLLMTLHYFEKPNLMKVKKEEDKVKKEEDKEKSKKDKCKSKENS
tara:strand:+ start:234 stop:1409 length:1176 start_codon:yes stop_codon:yes gene_type:complete